ncbi:kelch-like protein 23 [Arctopsyche grandis]|uniref:kelch-like protein 23 n=1 Tax=Arctopsyche grandis TaxID=121162 RepID=UPI00406D6BA1
MVVLSSCSEFFAYNQSTLSDIFSEFEDAVIDAILKYCYIGEIYIEETRLEKFLELANMLQIKNIDIPPKMPEYQTIDLSNCLEVLRLSDDQKLKKIALDLTVENFNTLCKITDFLNLPVSIVSEILKSNELNVASEEDVFKSLKLWVNFDDENRRSELLNLMSSVRLTLIPVQRLITEIIPYCYSSLDCMIIVNKAMQSMLLRNPQSPHRRDVHRKGTYKLAVVGSWMIHQNTIDIYDAEQDTWTQSKDIGINKWGYGLVLVDNCIMIIGGFSSNTSKIVECIDLKDGQKYPLQPLNDARYGLVAVALNQDHSTDVYVICGARSWDVPLNSVERWNSKKRIWETDIAPTLQALLLPCASVINGRIYMTGGYTFIDKQHRSINEVQMYVPETNTWSYRAPMIQERAEHKSVVMNGKLYVVGGYIIQSTTYIENVESYDPEANLWTSFCNLPGPRLGANLCVFQNKLILIGGNYKKIDLSDVLEYDVINKKWVILKSLNIPRRYAWVFLIPPNSII